MGISNNKKICFVICTNNELYLEEAIHYVYGLCVPEGYEIEILSTADARSMTSGYNEIMNYTDAKYKIYIHQDVMIIDKDILFKLLEIFEDESIGMIGVVGSPKLPDNGIMWNGDRIGAVYTSNVFCSDMKILGYANNDYEEVEAIDGLFMATQYDIPWREDLFKHWDFYDISQSFEFRKAGYKVVVPKIDKPWVIHDDGLSVLKNSYYEDRLLFLKEYQEMMIKKES